MKRIIYILSAIFSAAAAAVFIIRYITDMIQEGGFFFYIYYWTDIAVMLAISILSVIQLKRHTPGIMLMLCGYVFYEFMLVIFRQYLFGLLFMAVALTPAIYEFSHYGMTVRQEPKRREKYRWMPIAATALALVLSVCRVILINMRASADMYLGFWSFSLEYTGIAVLLCATVFCVLINRRTSVLYRMFFTGCFICYAVPIVITPYDWFPTTFHLSDTMRIFLISMAVLCALFVLLILLHSSLTRRSSIMSHKPSDITQKAEMRSQNR